MQGKSLTYRNIFRFFWPLAVTNILMGITMSIVNAGLTRRADSITAIAAFSVAYVVAVFLNSPVYAAQQTALVLVKSRQSLRKVHAYLLLQAVAVFALQVVIVYSPVGRWLMMDFVGVDRFTSDLALKSILIWLPFALLISWRGLLQSFLIRYKKTFYISVATFIRILVMLWVLFFFPGHNSMHGALLGAVSITVSIVVEVLVVLYAAFPLIKKLPADQDNRLTLRKFVKFSVPLSLSMLLWTAAGFLLNSIVAHSMDSKEALAVMALAYSSFGWFVSAPAKVLLQTTLTLIKDRFSHGLVMKFSLRLVAVLTGLMLILTLPGIFNFFFSKIFIVEKTLLPYLHKALMIVVFYPAAIGLRNYLQGNLVRDKRTSIVSVASIGRLLLLTVAVFLTKAAPLSHGAISGLLILIGSIYLENMILWYYYKRKKVV